MTLVGSAKARERPIGLCTGGCGIKLVRLTPSTGCFASVFSSIQVADDENLPARPLGRAAPGCPCQRIHVVPTRPSSFFTPYPSPAVHPRAFACTSRTQRRNESVHSSRTSATRCFAAWMSLRLCQCGPSVGRETADQLVPRMPRSQKQRIPIDTSQRGNCNRGPISAPTLDPSPHAVWSMKGSELKHLYTAITRTKHVLPGIM